MKETAELLPEIITHIDPATVIPVAVAIVVFGALYFLLRTKKAPAQTDVGEPEVVSEETGETQFTAPEPVSVEEKEVLPPAAPPPEVSEELPPAKEPPSPQVPPAKVPESARDTQFVAPEPVSVKEKEVAPPPAPAHAAPLEVSKEPERTEPPPSPPEEDTEDGEPEREVISEQKEEDAEGDFFSRLSLGLSKTRRGILQNLEHVFSSGSIDDATWDEFEEILIMSDMGVSTTAKLRERVSSAVKAGSGADIEKIKTLLEKEILDILRAVESPVAELSARPTVFMVAGVNGVGKTTSIGKIANRFTREGKKVMVAAADTFRAAAVEQLGVWAERVGSDFLRGQSGADPSAVAYDAVKASVSRGIDLLVIDTAGRVHTKTGLMEELKKLRRVVERELEGAPHETLLVVDATTGQNAVEQARVFGEAIGVSGIVLTKLDGSAKGGIIVAIAQQLGLPVKYIGVGEGLEDLREFDAEQFTKALFASDKEASR